MDRTESETPGSHSLDPKRIFLVLLLFSVSFGYVEAALVVYLRELCEPLRQEIPVRRAANSFRSSNWRTFRTGDSAGS